MEALVFPALSFSQNFVLPVQTEEELTTATKAGLKGGWYDDLLVVGSNCVAIRVSGARKLHGVGRFWGYDVFFGQLIRVELSFAGPPFQIRLDDLRERVLRSFSDQHDFWSEAINFEEMQTTVEQAQSVREIIRDLG